MTVAYLDPRAEPGIPIEAYMARLSADGVTVTVGLLANGFPDSVAFLDHVEKALTEATPAGTSFLRYDKGNASVPVSIPMIDQMCREVQVVVTAYGH